MHIIKMTNCVVNAGYFALYSSFVGTKSHAAEHNSELHS